MKTKTGDEIHTEIADNSPDAYVMTKEELIQCEIDDKKRREEKWVRLVEVEKRLSDMKKVWQESELDEKDFEEND